ncbi:MAG: dephospho-CoA kinase [Candidatus Acidiferrales bacterium]
MLRAGLTGGIASGKSTVARMLRGLDVPLLEADPIGHELLEPGQEAREEIVREFGGGILGADGAVDREKLGAIIFADREKRARLNRILHPRILGAARIWFAALDRPGGPGLAVFSAALIFESGYDKELDRVIVCWCPPEQQLARLKERGLSTDEARRRIAAQMPSDEKLRMADEVIDSSGSMEETERQVREVAAKLKRLGSAGEKRP